MDEFDVNNPFGVEFRPDAPIPPSSPPPPDDDDDDNDDDDNDDDGDLQRKEWRAPGPVVPEYFHESTLLQTANQLITNYGDNPNHVVKSKSLNCVGIPWIISKM